MAFEEPSKFIVVEEIFIYNLGADRFGPDAESPPWDN
jgi:hypothetical protein